jgi:hypothetical protein
MEYKVVTESYISDLQKEVSLLISRGYIPQGGVSYGNGFYVQAMIKLI